MTQLNLLFRTTDPHTSRDAAAKVDTFKAGHEAKIYAAICESGWVTYREIASLTGLEPVAVGRRLVAMERRKLIRRDRDMATGRYRAFDGMALWYRA